METKSLKALAIEVLEGKSQGNLQETTSFQESKQEERSTFKRAKGYRCGCGHNLYQQVENFVEITQPEDANWEHHYRLDKLWQCENCKATFEIIGGSRGPQYIN